MSTTYFEATSIGRGRNAETGRMEIRGIRVAVMRPETLPDGVIVLPPEDEEIESAEFGPAAISAATAWLAARGCTEGEATRIIISAIEQFMGQSTGTGPTLTERVLGTKI